MERTELHLSDGRLAAVEIEDDLVRISADGTVLLMLSRPDAWKLAEALDALSTQA